MSSNIPTVDVVDDKTKPYKAVAAALVAALIVALQGYFNGTDEVTGSGVLSTLITAVVTFGLTYLVKNPKVVKTS
jgi:hypothetical protein